MKIGSLLVRGPLQRTLEGAKWEPLHEWCEAVFVLKKMKPFVCGGE